MGLVSLLFSFKGRISRAQYWFGSLGVGAGGVFLIFVLSFMSSASLVAAKTPGHAMGAFVGFALTILPVIAAMSWCGFALQVKRFHDRGRTGYLALIPLVIMVPMMVTLVGGAISNAPVEMVATSIQPFMLAMWAVNLWFFIDLGCLGSVDGPNKYGDPPGSPRSSAPSPQHTPGAVAGASSLFSAQSAMDRAIAERGAPSPAKSAGAAAPRPAAMPAPLPAGSPSFGRRATR